MSYLGLFSQHKQDLQNADRIVLHEIYDETKRDTYGVLITVSKPQNDVLIISCSDEKIAQPLYHKLEEKWGNQLHIELEPTIVKILEQGLANMVKSNPEFSKELVKLINDIVIKEAKTINTPGK